MELKDGAGDVIDTAAVGFHLYDPGYHDQSDSTYGVLSYTRRQAVRYLEENKPAFFTFYIGDVDLWGHDCGWESEEYRKCLAQTDEAIALVIQTLKDQGMYDDTVIVVTSDHGGMGNGHGGFTLKEMETPFVIAGKNVARKGEIDSFMMQYDVAATLAEALGLFYSLLAPYAGVQISGFLFQHVVRHHAELQAGTASQEQYAVALRYTQQLLHQGLCLIHYRLEILGTVADLKNRQPLTLKIQYGLSRLLNHFLRQDTRSRVKIVFFHIFVD
jgi:hypothetical protein